MGIEEETFQRAQKGKRADMVAVLERVYAMVRRMALGLSGREDAGREVVHVVMRQGLTQLPRWRDGEGAERWFYHHTVLTSRRGAGRPVKAPEDVLVRGQTPDGAYVAFVRALRELPLQQREAFVLHHGEGLNARYLGIAMDCSSKAAEMHLQAATAALKAMAGEELERVRDAMKRAYQALTPDEQVMVPAVRKAVARAVWPATVRRGLILAAIAGLAAGVWWWWGRSISL